MNKNPMNRRKPSANGDMMRNKIMEYLTKNETTVVPVTIREIGASVGIPSSSVVEYYLTQLEAQGKIKREEGRMRFIKLVKDG